MDFAVLSITCLSKASPRHQYVFVLVDLLPHQAAWCQAYIRHSRFTDRVLNIGISR